MEVFFAVLFFGGLLYLICREVSDHSQLVCDQSHMHNPTRWEKCRPDDVHCVTCQDFQPDIKNPVPHSM